MTKYHFVETNYEITPVPKPRQTQSDRWKQRACVMRYRAFADECREQGMEIVNGATVIFNLPMPKSWSKKKKALMLGKGHQQKPDVDNLLKAVMDAVLQEDCHIYDIHSQKFWAEKGSIKIL